MKNVFFTKSIKQLLLITLMVLVPFFGRTEALISVVGTTEVESVLKKATSDIMAERKDNSYWLYPSYIGMMYASQYYLMSHWLGLDKQSEFDAKKLKNLIVTSQRPDGSWEIIHEANLPVGDINPTIYHYWALKVMGTPVSEPAMVKARNFILSKGGLQKASQFTRVFLSLFNNLSWEDFPSIPYMLFDRWSPVNEHQFAQWVGSHLIAIAYLQKNKVFKNLGSRFQLDELKLRSNESVKMTVSHKPESDDIELVPILLSKQQPHGSFGGYTPATQLSMAVIDHLIHRARLSSTMSVRLAQAMRSGFDFLEEMIVRNPEGAYKGVACDGRYWDTALVGQGLIEAGIPARELRSSVDYLMTIQNEQSGGYGFGYDFESYEDTDDTAEILLFYKKAGYWHPQHRRALAWLFEMQNSDGGWGAFAKNNDGNFFLERMTKDFLDSADLFDESSADVTGHILEALGAYGYNVSNSKEVREAIDYLRRNQNTSFGGWEGRWGVNYIYGTSAAVIGLMKVGIPASDPMIVKALNWLERCPNRFDGGFGESFQSYTHENFKCGGRSTASQTAWALMALLEGGRGRSSASKGAASYLTHQYRNEGRWIDVSFVGTGHPRIVPMEYPAYPKSFTLMALGRYLKQIQSK
ncbi:MAG: hypothetical protein RJB66_29 [Pseudomonadota bacterium]